MSAFEYAIRKIVEPPSFSSNLEEFYMKAIKTLLAVSALATITGAANATVWNIDVAANPVFPAAGGPLILDLHGTYDDAATVNDAVLGVPVTGLATMSGNVYIPGFSTSIHYNNIQFDMGADGYGATIQPDASPSNCSDNTGSGCPGFSQALVFPLYNAINFAFTTSKAGTFDNSTANPFVVAPGSYVWTGIANVPVNGKNTLAQLPVNVTISAQTPTVPVPAAAWLFGSGLLGLAGTARRRRAS